MANVQPEYPWASRSYVRGNLAIGHLRENLKIRLQVSGRLHAETVLCAIGAIVGCASQNAAWKESGLTAATAPSFKPGGQLPTGPIFVWKLPSGEVLHFGDLLNSFLSPQPGYTRPFQLWGFVAGALAEAAVPPADFPDLGAMYGRVAKSIGTAEFGIPTAPPEHRPHMPANQLAKLLWPFMRQIMVLPTPEEKRGTIIEPALDEEHWPIIASIVANQLMVSTREVLDPMLAATIVMESAIVASKLELARQ